jgi:large subunit ribosomal protein L4
MASATLYSSTGEQQGKVNLPDSVFADEVHGHALYETVKAYLANQRQGTHKTKNRHEVSGQKSKLYKQKGTGRARAGGATTGLRVGGGRIHGPRPRDYSYAVPRQVRRLALRSALTDRAQGSNIHVVEDLQLGSPSTRAIATLLAGIGVTARKVLLVSAAADGNLLKSCRNIPNLDVQTAQDINAYQVMAADELVVTRAALGRLEEVFGA